LAKPVEKADPFWILLKQEMICNIYTQESLANAKVNARQHCVSLSCLYNSLTQIEWMVDFSLGDEDSANIARKDTKIGILDDHFLV